MRSVASRSGVPTAWPAHVLPGGQMISVHCAASSGATVMLALTYEPAFLAACTLVGLVAWSRAELKDHTPAQAAAGTVLGAALSADPFLTLR